LNLPTAENNFVLIVHEEEDVDILKVSHREPNLPWSKVSLHRQGFSNLPDMAVHKPQASPEWMEISGQRGMRRGQSNIQPWWGGRGGEEREATPNLFKCCQCQKTAPRAVIRPIDQMPRHALSPKIWFLSGIQTGPSWGGQSWLSGPDAKAAALDQLPLSQGFFSQPTKSW